MDDASKYCRSGGPSERQSKVPCDSPDIFLSLSHWLSAIQPGYVVKFAQVNKMEKPDGASASVSHDTHSLAKRVARTHLPFAGMKLSSRSGTSPSHSPHARDTLKGCMYK